MRKHDRPVYRHIAKIIRENEAKAASTSAAAKNCHSSSPATMRDKDAVRPARWLPRLLHGR